VKPLSVSEVYFRVSRGDWTPEQGAKLLEAMAEQRRAWGDVVVRVLMTLGLVAMGVIFFAGGRT